jgi:hypothetical protein
MSNEFEEQDADRAWEERLRAMIAQLPKDKTASQLLEERTVSVLRRRGLLQSRQARRLRRAWLVGGIAASVALFASGVVVGQWLSSRTTASVMLAMTRNDQFRAAAHVQRTGTQFVNALQALAHSADSTNTLPAQGREVSLAALYAAASEVVRFAPNDPIAAEIMRGFQRVSQQQMAQPERGSARQILWF